MLYYGEIIITFRDMFLQLLIIANIQIVYVEAFPPSLGWYFICFTEAHVDGYYWSRVNVQMIQVRFYTVTQLYYDIRCCMQDSW